MKTKLASLLVAASIVTSFYFQSNNAVLNGQGRFLKYKVDTFTSFAVGGWEKYRHDVYEPWRTRLLSTMPANFMFKPLCQLQLPMIDTRLESEHHQHNIHHQS